MSQTPSAWTDETTTPSSWASADGSMTWTLFNDSTVSYDGVYPYDGQAVPLTTNYTSDDIKASSWGEV
jgi:hypothetical protein